MTDPAQTAYVDESSIEWSPDDRAYLVAATLILTERADDIRAAMSALKLKGQRKLHWTDEKNSRRRKMVETVAKLGVTTMFVAHIDAPTRKTERHRRLCLEVLYTELEARNIRQVVFESRTPHQDKQDLAHLVSLQGKGLYKGLRISHQPGGDEPLLWIPDLGLGAYNAHKRDGDTSYLTALGPALLPAKFTATSKTLED